MNLGRNKQLAPPRLHDDMREGKPSLLRRVNCTLKSRWILYSLADVRCQENCRVRMCAPIKVLLLSINSYLSIKLIFSKNKNKHCFYLLTTTMFEPLNYLPDNIWDWFEMLEIAIVLLKLIFFNVVVIIFKIFLF
jgi:hypothetical protein